MILKILFFVLGALSAFAIAQTTYSLIISAGIGLVFGVITTGLAWAVEDLLKGTSSKGFQGAALGIASAAIVFFALNNVLYALSIPENVLPFVSAAFFFVLLNIGLTLGFRKGRETEQSGGRGRSHQKSAAETKILDTSVIIDGRIADVAEAGFINGTMIIPRFIIKELQRRPRQ